MNCQETRERLSAFVDNELDGGEQERVRGHLAGCPECRQQLRDQGALDMLLKSCFVKEPPEVSLDGVWPNVSERMEGGDESKSGNGGGTVRDGGDIVFKSSSAMQMLRIPEVAAPAPVKAPSAPPERRSGWAWPVALVVSSAILAGGFLLYKKMMPQASQEAASSQPSAVATADGGVKVATAPVEEPAAGAASQPASAEPSAEESTRSAPGAITSSERKASSKTKRHPKAAKVATASGKTEVASRVEPKPEPKAEPAAKAGRKGGRDDLDNLIDDAIGPGQAPSKKKKEAAPKAAPSEDIPEQLTMNQIRGAMNKVKGQVQACYDKYQIEGEARVSFTIKPDGSVSDCTIKGKFFGTDTGSCVVAAVKRARFPKFSGKPIAIPNYPFMLQ